MTATYGPTSPMPLATYDPAESCWRTSEITCLWALTLSSLTLPEWGSMRGGVLFEHPTPERLTAERDCSSSPTLPTPRAAQHKAQVIYQRIDGPGNLEEVLYGVITGQPWRGGNTSPDAPHQPPLPMDE